MRWPATGRPRAALAIPGAVVAILLLAAPVPASLPRVETGKQPGPELLHEPPPRAPQLENRGPWRAEPILVSGAWAYREGEFVYQDYLHDDRGAAGLIDPAQLTNLTSEEADVTSWLGAPPAGTVTYPTESAFANNAADLVELRVRPLGRATAFRITLNTLNDPSRTAVTIAIASSPEPREWPHGAGVRSPAELFLTVHGEHAELREAVGGAVRAPAPRVAVDLGRRQLDVRVRHAAWDPGDRTVRLAAGVGLWDREAGRYLAPGPTATESTPGGAAPSGAALFNLGFRFDEPLPDWELGRVGYTIADWALLARLDGSWWRERAQADALAAGDVSRFFAEVDFAKLASGVGDDSGVPRRGPINRILASRFSFGQGVDYSRFCYRSGPPCEGPLVGQLQPYAVYVPDRRRPRSGWGLTLMLHSWTTNHNQFQGSRFQSQLGERGAGSLVATPEARGPDGEYVDIAEADVYEVWADLARHYALDPDWVVGTGYSMGAAGGTPTRWPDLFGRGMTAAAVPEGEAIKSMRNVPVMTWIGHLDEGTDIGRQEAAVAELAEQGLRFVFDQFPTADHLTLAMNDEWGPVAEFLGEHRVDRDPPQISYVVDPRRDSERAGLIADHAYWLSGLRVRDPAASPTGEIDARSEAFGVGDPPALGVTSSLGILEGGSKGPMPYLRREQDWAPAPRRPRTDRLVVRARNVASATVDVRRARLSCRPKLRVDTDGPLRLRLGGCGRVIRFRSNRGGE